MSLDGVGGSLGTAVNYSVCLHFLFWIRLFISQVFQMTERERERALVKADKAEGKLVLNYEAVCSSLLLTPRK